MSTVEDIREEYNRLVDVLRQQRDELNVKVHLASMEVRDEWEELEKKWQHMKAKGKQVHEVAGDSAHEIHYVVMDLGYEIKKGYKRLKDIL